ncbi:Gfo/Idh/MocA family protein [Rheinheimera nanhaiensis]|uniref:NAD-binding oxidoreductase n=1 Tax=Rheinheimera nanhaiensis E407-8 TaxID=562729 RepID=I1DWZ6_9GAMM|nr:Gfo/Idh/MocA family oxidoreductase [Rheinheimera nanhaiensis]GAB58574.1 NAD-binding oxidoreductase [Rheinheimera nanhaiensis E407-8]
MIRIGLLGAARISDKAIFQPLKQLDGFVLQAVAASAAERARQYAGAHGILHVADSYQALLERDDIDLIYNALPPSEHAHWTIQALEHGKHVLCEKPFAMDEAEAKAMVQAAKASGQLLLEAFHYRFHPLFVEVMRLVQAGTIGTISHLRANFSVRVPYFAGSLRHEAALGGGAMMDLGCYPLHWVRTVIGSEPWVLNANCITAGATTGGGQIDLTMQAQLQFANGVIADIGSSMAEHLSRMPDTSLVLEGSLGSIEVTGLITPQLANSIKVISAGSERQYSVPGHSTYYYQLQHVQECLQGREAALTGGSDAVNNMRLLDQIYQHAGLLSRGRCRR